MNFVNNDKDNDKEKCNKMVGVKSFVTDRWFSYARQMCLCICIG